MNATHKNVILIAVTVVALGLAAWLFARSQPAKLPLADSYQFLGACLACKQEVSGSYKRGELEPYHCPLCNQQAAFVWRYCYDCEKRTIPRLVRREPEAPKTVPPFATCSKCNCPEIGQYDPAMPDQHPKGDNPLPPWP